MPVTHGVTGSSPVRTARNLPLLIGVAGVFVFFRLSLMNRRRFWNVPRCDENQASGTIVRS